MKNFTVNFAKLSWYPLGGFAVVGILMYNCVCEGNKTSTGSLKVSLGKNELLFEY